MAEDQNELGLENDKTPVPDNNLKYSATSEVDEKDESENKDLMSSGGPTVENTEKKHEKVPHDLDKDQDIDAVKEVHEDDDHESSQSMKLVLEDTEGNDELKSNNKDEHVKHCIKINENQEDLLQNNKVNKVEEIKNVEGVKTNEVGLSVIDANKANESTEEIKKHNVVIENHKSEDRIVIEEVKNKPKHVIKDDPVNDTPSEEKALKETKRKEKSLKDDESCKDKAKVEIDRTEAVTELKIGIVSSPTVASELLNEEELATEKPALPTDDTKAAISDRVVRWVENTAAKADDPTTRLDVEIDDVEEEDDDDDEEEVDEEKKEEIVKTKGTKTRTKGRKRKQNNGTNGTKGPSTRKSQKVVTSIIRRSIRCLNKMHAMESSGSNGKKVVDSAVESKRGIDDEDSRKSPKVPQSQQNGAALPEETASSDRNILHCSPSSSFKEKKDSLIENYSNQHQQPQATLSKSSKLQLEITTATKTTTTTTTTMATKQSRAVSQRGTAAKHQQQQQQDEHREQPSRETRKRRSADINIVAVSTGVVSLSSNGNPNPKKLCLDQREQFINSLIGSDKFTAEQLAARSEQLRGEVQDLDELARAKEMEWNEILSMRKLKEEAYLRIERRRQIMGFMESNGSISSDGFLPPASLVLSQQNYDGGGGSSHANAHAKDKGLVVPKEERGSSVSRDSSPAIKRERSSKVQSSYQQSSKQQALAENGPKQILDAQSPEHRQIGEGRQGPIVDVRSIIADYRLRHPETVPRRRGRRMRNSVNVGLGAGGAMVETVGNMDSRPSSTDSCKSNSNVSDPNNAMSFKDVLVQFAKLSQQQGEPIKTPQNYPDVTLHPVAAPPTTQNSVPQTSGSLLHGILTKSQSPRPTTFSPTLARLLTAPERERSAPTITTTPHQTTTQHLLQAYQGANPVSISDFLSSSKTRTEITITPVVNNPIQTHSNNLIHVDDVQEETSIIEERDSRLSMGTRDNRDDRDSPPRCQGCHERAAQFVCAGCGNQWYCSRECQVAAWDEHSEVCSG